MTSHHLRRSGVAAILVCTIVCWASAMLRAEPAVGLSVELTSVTFSRACNSTQPVATLHASVRNAGLVPSVAQHFTVRDESSALSGSADIPALDPGASTSVDVPLTTIDSARLAGRRSLSVYLGSAVRSAPLAQTVLDLPQTFCRAGIDSVSRVAAPLAIPAAAPRAAPATSVSLNPNRGLVHLLDIMPPLHVRAALGTSDCEGHHPAFNCTESVLGGHLILLWEPPESGGSVGYRVYGVDENGNAPARLASTTMPGQTVVEMPVIAGKYAGHCYAVTTMFGARESTKSAVFCATDGSSTKVTSLSANEARSVVTDHFSASVFKELPTYGQAVGYHYTTQKHGALRADDFGNAIHRSGFAFDLAPYVGHRLVRARLHLTIQTSQGMSNNYSCANSVGTGKEFWWKDDASPWIEGDFSSSPTPPTVGPQIVADVTTLAAPWFAGAPNYGFVIRNTDENLNAFTEKQCETTYENPLLEITYY